MKKKGLTGMILSCMLLLPLAARAQDADPALIAKAQQGDTAAQEKLGDYYFGQNDNATGLKWLKKLRKEAIPTRSNRSAFVTRRVRAL